jgi:hypothetical protein
MDTDGVVEVLARTGVELAEQLLRADGSLPPPTVYLLTKFLPDPYLGGVAARPYRRGADAAAAVAELGSLASVARATRLVVIWEHQDLLVSLQQDPDAAGYPNGVVVLDAAFFDHVVRWYPARFRLPGDHDDATAVVVPEWGEPVRHVNATLPAPVDRLLETWREVRGGDVAAELARLEAAGFLTSWRSERDGVGQLVRR